jgi:hypothetical protein
MDTLLTEGLLAAVTVRVTGTKEEKQGVLDHVIFTTPFPAFPFIFPPAGFGIDAFPAIVEPFVTPPMYEDPPPPPSSLYDAPPP